LMLSLALTACGPERGESQATLTDQVVTIAQGYSQSGDLGRARAELETLDVANPTQFLIFLAEDQVRGAPDAADTAALARLALALGLQSKPLVDYAVANGLLADTAAPAPIAQLEAGAQGLQPVASAQQTPTVVTIESTGPVVQLQPAPDETAAPQAEAIGTTAPLSDTLPSGSDAGAAPAVELPTATLAATPIPNPRVQASNSLNVRSGPGTAYPVVAALNTGEQADIVAKNPGGDWWQVTLSNGTQGWVYGPLVQTSGDTSAIAVAANIPDAPPTPTPAPVAAAPETPAEQAPADQPPAEQPPAEAPAEPAPAAPPADGPDFVVIERRLWNVEETGGRVDAAGSVICGEKRELWVNVVDVNGVQLNGVHVQAIYGNKEIYVTGDQGKGPGKVEFVLGQGQGVRVVRDNDGREVTSQDAEGMITKSWEIPQETLIGSGYCRDKESCDKFNYSAGCYGHHSWTVTFQRRY
jgi:uncharacterized protein YraI